MPQITNGWVFVSISRYWFLNSCAWPLLWIFSNFMRRQLVGKNTDNHDIRRKGFFEIFVIASCYKNYVITIFEYF